jgi:hypothetical protein
VNVRSQQKQSGPSDAVLVFVSQVVALLLRCLGYKLGTVRRGERTLLVP